MIGLLLPLLLSCLAQSKPASAPAAPAAWPIEDFDALGPIVTPAKGKAGFNVFPTYVLTPNGTKVETAASGQTLQAPLAEAFRRARPGDVIEIHGEVPGGASIGA